MNGKFFAYALVVTVLSTGVSWTKFIRAATTNSEYSSSSGRGSSWSSNTGGSSGSWGSGSSGGHK